VNKERKEQGIKKKKERGKQRGKKRNQLHKATKSPRK